MFNWLVLQQVVPSSPALFVKVPKFSRDTGVPPVLEPAQMRALLDSLATESLKALRDRALIAVMEYTFARVSAVADLRRERLQPVRQAPAAAAARKRGKGKDHLAAPPGRGVSGRLSGSGRPARPQSSALPKRQQNHHLTGHPMSRTDMLRMVKARCRAAGLPGLRSAIIRFAERASRSSYRMVARSKQLRAWPGIRTAYH